MGNGYVVAGVAYTDDVIVRNGGGATVDPDAGTLSLTIKDPDGVTVLVVAEADLTRASAGHYSYTWATASDMATGTWTWVWDATVEGADLPDKPATVVVLPVGSLGTSLMSLASLREFVTSSLSDAALQALLDATAAAIARVAGSSASRTERIEGCASTIMLAGVASSISSVVERSYGVDTTLAPDDYELSPSKISLRRLSTGTHPRSTWSDEADVTYVPEDDIAQRKSVQLALVKLELARNPGLTSERLGDWAASYAAAADTDAERQNLLSQLIADHLVFFG